MKKRLITIIGARPQIIKSSAVNRAIRRYYNDELDEVIVHTGQHYDENMSDVFFQELGIPQPHYNLNVGSGSHAAQTAAMLTGLESIFLKENPFAVLVYGDTNSTLAGALAAAKIHIPVIHVEAGLRSFNKAMPEEINRICCDHLSTLLFTPTLTGYENLKKEGFSLHLNEKAHADHPNVYHCGDVMYDNSIHFSELSAQKSTLLKELKLEDQPFVLVTIHRDSNTDSAEKMEAIFTALCDIQEKSGLFIVLPIHPRTKNKLQEQLSPALFNRVAGNVAFKIIPPAGFLDIIALEKNAGLIITDSGGLQKEAYFFKKPCVILREQTEWVEIVENGNALLTGADYGKILAAFDYFTSGVELAFPELYGDGEAGKFICERILQDLEDND